MLPADTGQHTISFKFLLYVAQQFGWPYKLAFFRTPICGWGLVGVEAGSTTAYHMKLALDPVSLISQKKGFF